MNRKSVGIVVLITIGFCCGPLAAATMGVKEAQQALKAKGYYKGKLDGISGPKTKGAITDFQNAMGLPATGVLDDATAGKLSSSSVAADASGSVKGAVKEASGSAKGEAGSAVGEIKGVFGKKPKTPPKK